MGGDLSRGNERPNGVPNGPGCAKPIQEKGTQGVGSASVTLSPATSFLAKYRGAINGKISLGYVEILPGNKWVQKLQPLAVLNVVLPIHQVVFPLVLMVSTLEDVEVLHCEE